MDRAKFVSFSPETQRVTLLRAKAERTRRQRTMRSQLWQQRTISQNCRRRQDTHKIEWITPAIQTHPQRSIWSWPNYGIEVTVVIDPYFIRVFMTRWPRALSSCCLDFVRRDAIVTWCTADIYHFDERPVTRPPWRRRSRLLFGHWCAVR